MIQCRACKQAFDASPEQQNLIDKATAKGMSFVMLKCPKCWMSFGYDLKMRNDEPEEDREKESLRCPVSRCSGWVAYVDKSADVEKPFWGCGECGSMWFKRQSLNRDIENIINKYPYRSPYYDLKNGTYLPSGFPEALDYQNRVEQEDDDDAPDFIRD
ncbi:MULTISPECIES: hypothetical protein [Paraburkholderia]|uniref:hypothetical protein n=1 Tax=Paraburkholderia TaxID=1822464 RepID=UPI00224F34D6|nr:MULTISPECIES: hypothetical protein [Paraburkholderia]MCX4162326.1 hypothetical protein [Paraburkholderia megapolitana]MDN7157821.1 hypothetical protein [Paraburkholderia sp. CHISQ3]MDQ6494868.1 hypothetical protein [Paraburkholderia megapolitana]